MANRHVLLYAAASLWVTGLVRCQEQRKSLQYVELGMTQTSLDEAVRLADQRVTEELQAADGSVENGCKAVTPEGRELAIEDYTKTISLRTIDDRPVMSVHYRCHIPLGYFGAWSSFGVWVYLDDSTARYRRGAIHQDGPAATWQ